MIACGLFALVAVGCGDNIEVETSTKDLTAWSLPSAHNSGLGSDIDATIMDEGVFATVPFGTDVTRLVASFADTGVTVDVGGTDQVSEQTPNDFTSPVVYTVTAEDGTVRQYAVALTVELDHRADLTAFSFTAAANPTLTADVTATITDTSITAEVPDGTDLTTLVATFGADAASVVVDQAAQVSGTTVNDFTDEVDYDVTAVDGTEQTYTVDVTVAPPI
jgi:hypothetical protein